MTISPLECLDALEAQGVRIYLTNDRLQIIAPQDVLTEEYREVLRGGRDEIIEFIRNRRSTRVPDGPGPVVPVDRGGALPLSFGQQRLWFLAQLEPDSAEYNAPMAVRLGGPLDVAALSTALSALVKRHEVLRTRLVAGVDGVPYQVIDPAPAAFDLPTVDLAGEDDPVAAVREWLARDAALPFDLAAGPAFRATLLRLGADDHILSLARHHIVSDESSARILRREIPLLYASARRGEPAPLAPLPVQYADFAVWQREWLTGEVLERHLDYWRDRLAGAPVSEVPTDRPRPPVRSSAGAVVEFEVPPRVTDGLRAVARGAGATLFMTLLAAFNVLLSRYSRQDDSVVGVPVANRDRTEIEGLIGFFINTLVLRTDLSGDPTFTELLARVRSGVLDAYEHRDLPFEHLVDALEIERDLSRNPPCQVLLNYVSEEEAKPAPADEDRDAAEEVTFDFDPRSVFGEAGGGSAATSAKSDLELTLAEAGGGLAGALEYSTVLFEDATMRRLIGHLLELLEAVAADADRRVSQLPVLTAGERRELERWNDTASALPAVGGVHELVAEWASAAPAAPAVTCGGDALTYGELEARANRLARYLRVVGVGTETVVGLCLGRGADWVVALLAVWKAGGAYLPLDPEYPADRLAFMLADGGVSVLVGTESAVEDLPAGRTRSVILDDPAVAASVAGQDGSPLEVGVLPDQLAYVMYTSGSTGRPKGVQVAHRGVVNLALAQAEAFGVGAGDVALQFASFGFDAAVSEVCVALAAGARVVIADALERSEPGRLAALVRDAGVDVATLPPSLLGVLSTGDLDGLRTLVAAGEALGAEQARVWAAGHRLLNAYGPTETTVCASVSEPVDPGSPGVPPIGRPIANMRVLVLDEALNPVPVGVPGEVFVGGAGLARGYRGRPELTAERFVADPSDGDGSRLYRTGDVARWRADGQLEFVGRADDQVKVRGFRVEPGEIEAALTAHPQVRQAVVVADEDQRLVAYGVPGDPAEGIPPAGELRRFLRDRLPEYMVPGVFVELVALPVSQNGKVDRAALPAPEGARPELTGDFVAPRTAAEELLAGIWGEILGLDRVGVHDNFFELGGHSLLATRVVSRARTAFAVDVPLAALFNAPTVAGLAEVIDGLAGSAEPPIVPVDRDLPLPLSYSQQRLWFLAQLEPGSVEYNTPMPVRLSGETDVEALRAALGALVERHEVLRTRLVADPDGAAHQVVDPPAPFPLPTVDLSGAENPALAAEEWIEQDAATPFDLATGPLFRATLVRIAEREHVLALAMHHVVSDEWSLGILRRELEALYEAFRAGRSSPLAPLPVQYADFAVWQRRWLTGEVLERQLAYWRERLAGAPVLELPTDRPRPPVRPSAGAMIDFAVPEPVARRLRALSRDADATMFMTLLSVFGVLLARYAGQDDIVVGTPIAGRTRAEVEGLVGCFINTLVLRTDLSGDPTFTELLARVRTGALDAYAHQDLPFEQLVDELVTERDRSRTPVFQALFNYLTEEVAPPGDTPDAVPQTGVTTRCDLRLIFAEATGGGLLGTVQYSTALFDLPTMERMAGHLLELLEAVADDADRSLSRLSMVPAAESRRLMEWNDTGAELPTAGGVHELVAARAARCLDAVAVVSGRDSLIYEELEIAANRLARYLGEAGVGPETVVGLCLGPGVDVIVSMLAIWKAGGAYLPLDPGYPADRLAYMLADAGVAMLVGTASAVDEMPVGRIRTVLMDDPTVAAAIEAQDAAAPETTVSPDQAAYVIYTSGSTGRPKGVQVTHRGLINYVTGVPGRVGLGGVGSRYALLQPAATDFGNTMIFSCLATGGTLHLVDPDVVTDPNAVSDYLTRHAIDYLKIVPSHLVALSSEYEPARLLPGRTLILGGEAAPRTWLSRLLETATGPVVFNHYGPTETTIGVATTRLDGGDPDAAGASVPIGSPIANTRLHVLDRHLNAVPVGVPGELFVGGACLARGYLNRPDLTGERFVADPFAGDGSRLYRTGDKVRWRADGRLEFLGRLDHQVKVRGFRVELGEIEAHLTAHAAVGSAVVVVDGEDESRRLVAYLTPADVAEGVPAAAELRKFLLRRLPEPMVPAVFVELSELPLTANGKLDRSALPEPDSVRPVPAETFVAPETYQERLLAGIWADVLKLDRVGTADNFFELGGHSLLVTQIVARVRATGHDISVGEFFDHPTVGRLAPLLRAHLDGTAIKETRSAFQLRNGDVTPPLFLIHPASGSVTDFADIASRLTRGQQAYGLQSLGLIDGDLPLETIEEMAGAYLDDVRVLQPDGPYLFAAWSMGCYVALEMARQVTAAGGEMGGLFLIGPPYHQERSADWIRMEWERARVLLRRVDETIDAEPGTRLPEDVEEYLLGSWDQDDDGVAAVRAGDKQRLRLGRALLTNFWAGVRYQDDPRRAEEPYGGRVVLFVPEDDLGERQRIMIEQWRRECGREPEIVPVPGKHRTVIYDDGAEAVGAWLSEEVARPT